MAEASAPGSSGNLGPGFDTLALAFEIRCRVEAAPSDAWRVDHVGAHRPEHGDVVIEAARLAVGDAFPLALRVSNEIPIGRGLGSSAAAATAGAAAAWAAAGHEATAAEVFEVATGIDGHPDNAAASVYGGFVSVTTEGRVLRLPLHESVRVIVAVPNDVLATSEARRVLSDSVARGASVRSLQRIVALVEGLRSADPDVMAAAAGDELHEGPRSHLNPRAERLIDTARQAGALHASWSGAGPSVLALAVGDVEAVVAAMQAELGDDGFVITPDVAWSGLRTNR